MKLIFSYRFAPSIKPEQRRAKWLSALKADESLDCLKENWAFRQDPKRPFVRKVRHLLRRAGHASDLHMKIGCTEAQVLAQRGCDVLTWGPGIAYGNAHAPNEFVPVNQLIQARDFYTTLIQELCG